MFIHLLFIYFVGAFEEYLPSIIAGVLASTLFVTFAIGYSVDSLQKFQNLDIDQLDIDTFDNYELELKDPEIVVF